MAGMMYIEQDGNMVSDENILKAQQKTVETKPVETKPVETKPTKKKA